jgi:hypothetical protein
VTVDNKRAERIAKVDRYPPPYGHITVIVPVPFKLPLLIAIKACVMLPSTQAVSNFILPSQLHITSDQSFTHSKIITNDLLPLRFEGFS